MIFLFLIPIAIITLVFSVLFFIGYLEERKHIHQVQREFLIKLEQERSTK